MPEYPWLFSTPEPSRNRRAGRLAVIAVLLATLVIPFLITGCGPQTPQAAVQDFLKARDEGNWNAFLSSVLPDNVRMMDQEASEYWRNDWLEPMSETLQFNPDQLKMKVTEQGEDTATVTLVGGNLNATDPAGGDDLVLDLATNEYTYTDPETGEKKTQELSETEMEGIKELTVFNTKNYKGTWYVDFPLEMPEMMPIQ